MYKKTIKRGEKCNYIFRFNNSISSDVFATLTSDCFLNLDSSDHIIVLNASATAKYASSLRWEDKILALDFIDEEIFSEGIICISSLIKDNTSSNSEREVLPFSAISDLCFSNSSNRNSGANKFTLSENNILNTLPFPINALNNILASRTNYIYEDPINLLDTSKLILSDNSSISLSDNLNLDENFSNKDSLDNLSLNACLATSDQLISACLSNDFFNSVGTDNVIFTIFTSLCNHVNYVQIYKCFDEVTYV